MSPETDYPLRTGPAERLGRTDLLWLGGLLLLALVPRLLVAARLGPICDDGYYYLAVADAYDRGDFDSALWYLNVNVYPVLLALFERAGLDTLAAAKVWGVAVATLTILPLFGWLRRLLDRRVAVAACGIYAVHPEFIEVSPEPIRDATFWLLAALGLYLVWRAVAERTLMLFASAGVAIALAAHTRTEGWLLVLPAVAWPFVRWNESPARRWRLAAGTVLAFTMTPLFVIAFNLTALHDHDRWEWGKLGHFRLVSNWLAGAEPTEMRPEFQRTTASASPANSQSPQAPVPLDKVMPALADRLEHDRSREIDSSSYLRSAAHALEPVPLLLMLAGAIVGRHLLLRREHLVLSAMCVAVLLGVWIRLVTLGEINGRYFLFCFFPASGSAGIGLLWVIAKVESGWARFAARPRAAVAATAIAAAVGTAHAAEAVAGTHPSRDREAAIGRLLGERLGRDRILVVLPHACRVGYYATGRLPVVMLDNTPIEATLQRHRAEVVILEHDYTPADRCADLTARLIRRGWRPYDLAGVRNAEDFVVLTGPPPAPDRSAMRDEKQDVR